MAELIMVKRRALPNEIGLFVNAEVFTDAFSTIKMDAEVTVTATTKVNQKYNRLSWHIARLVCDASEAFEYPEDARDFLLIECRHFRRRFDKLRDKAEVIPKATRDLDGTEWIRLLRRMGAKATEVFGIPQEAYDRQMREAAAAAPPRQQEPPPHEGIPDGPAMPPSEPAKPAHEAPAEPPIEPSEPGRAPDAAAAEPDAAREVPAKERKKRTKPGALAVKPADGPEPTPPTDPDTYEAHILAIAARHTDEAGFIVYWNSEAEWQLRQTCAVGVVRRKQIEAKLAHRFPMLAPSK